MQNGKQKKMPKWTKKYQYCNHHHEIEPYQVLVDLGDGAFVADKDMIPLLKALNDSGLKTRSHCGHTKERFVCIRMDNVESIVVRDITEQHSTRETKPGQELIISWTIENENRMGSK